MPDRNWMEDGPTSRATRMTIVAMAEPRQRNSDVDWQHEQNNHFSS